MFFYLKSENTVLYTSISQSFTLFLHRTCLCELDSKLYFSELVGIKVRNQEGEKVSLQTFSFENGARIKSPVSGLCTYLALALFFAYIFQEYG